MFEQLFNNPLLYSLSLTLLHFLWQGSLVALILKSLLSIVANNRSKLRYLLASLAMFTNAFIAVLTFIMVYPDTSAGVNSGLSPIPLTSLVNELTQQNPLLSYQELLPSILAYSLPYLSLMWLASVTMLAGKLLIEVRNVNILPVRASIAPSAELLARFNLLVKQIHLSSAPRLLISLKAEVPMAIGWLKPVVLLPVTMVTNLNAVQLEMLILHELAHIRRHDYLVNFLQTLIELLFFFHPCVHWVGKQMRNEREYCSDDIAVQHCGDALAYAHTLTDTASLCSKKHCKTIPQMAMAASGGDLKARILRLVDHHCAPTNNTSKWLAATSLLLALSLLSVNQLMTMPFSKQVNNQFPWQEVPPSVVDSYNTMSSMSSKNSSQHNTPTTITVADSSIAQQLVSKNLVQSTHQPSIRVENNTTPALNSRMSFPEDNPLSASKGLAVAQTPNEDDFNSEPYDLTSNSVSMKTSSIDLNISVPSAPKGSNRLQPVDRKTVQETPKKVVIAKQIHAQNNVLPERINSGTQPALIAQFDNQTPTTQISTLKTSASFNKEDQAPLNSEIFTKPLRDKITLHKQPYKQLSYNDEISELAAIDSQYHASTQLIGSTPPSLKRNMTSQGDTDIAEADIVDEAKLLNAVSPVYPNLAKRRGIEMEVKVNFIIDTNGRVKDLKFDSQSKLIYFKSAIRSAMRKWRFSPATINNSNVESNMTKIFSFSLHS